MSFKAILVPMEQHDSMTATLETALLLARKFNGYLEGFALRSAILDLYTADITGTMPVAEVKESDAKFVAEARAAFEAFMKDHGVAQQEQRTDQSKERLSYGWLDDAPDGVAFVGNHGRVFDITVLGRPGSSMYSPRMTTLEAALFESGRPVLIAPPAPLPRLGENVVIAWNGSTEQARATAFAMPLLRQAGRVTVLTVEGGMTPGPSGDQLIRSLRLNGVTAQALNVKPANQTTGEAILAQATTLGCDLLIKGAYTQSRLRQLIFGGATRHILANATIPVLMAH